MSDMKDYPKLLPCAHCGGKAWYSECVDYICICCMDCEIKTEHVYYSTKYDRLEKVVAIWNRRVNNYITSVDELLELLGKKQLWVTRVNPNDN